MFWITNRTDQSVPISLYILHDEESQDLARVQDTRLAPDQSQEIQIYLLNLDDFLLSVTNSIRGIESTV